jgi:hypothetical protein
MMHQMRGFPRYRLAIGLAVLSLAQALGAQTGRQKWEEGQQAAWLNSIPSWKTYSYPRDGFTAIFPHEPFLFPRDKKDTKAGAFPAIRCFGSMDAATNTSYSLCVTDEPVSPSDPDALLDSTKPGPVPPPFNYIPRLLSKKKITLDGYPGVEFVAESATKRFATRSYLVGATHYTVSFTSAASDYYKDKEAARFFDSFRLIPRIQK